MHITKNNEEPVKCHECGETVEVYFEVKFDNFLPIKATPFGNFPLCLTLCERCAETVLTPFDYFDETGDVLVDSPDQ